MTAHSFPGLIFRVHHHNHLLQRFPSSFRFGESRVRFVESHCVFDLCCSSVKGRCNLLHHRAWDRGNRRAGLCRAVAVTLRIRKVSRSLPRWVGQVAGPCRPGARRLRFLRWSGRLPSLLPQLLIWSHWDRGASKLSRNTYFCATVDVTRCS